MCLLFLDVVVVLFLVEEVGATEPGVVRGPRTLLHTITRSSTEKKEHEKKVEFFDELNDSYS